MGIEVCKDDILNPMKFSASFSNKETSLFVEQIYSDENQFNLRIKNLKNRFSRSPTLEKKEKKEILKKAEVERVKKE